MTARLTRRLCNRAAACGLTVLGLLLAHLPAGAAGAPGEVAEAVPEATHWWVRAPADMAVAYRGMPEFEGAGLNTAPMMYVAPGGLIGLLAAVAVHGAISDSVLSGQKDKIREEADKVLVPYQAVLQRVTHRVLIERALPKVAHGASRAFIDAGEALPDAWVIESTPVFMITRDHRALVLDNAIVVKGPGSPAVRYQGLVRVVASPRTLATEPADLPHPWLADDGRLLAEESSSLFAESLDIVLAELAKGPRAAEPTQKTVRYAEGGLDRMERGTLLVDGCDRVLLKTLRGGLMSVPRRAPTCKAPQAAVAKEG